MHKSEPLAHQVAIVLLLQGDLLVPLLHAPVVRPVDEGVPLELLHVLVRTAGVSVKGPTLAVGGEVSLGDFAVHHVAGF